MPEQLCSPRSTPFSPPQAQPGHMRQRALRATSHIALLGDNSDGPVQARPAPVGQHDAAHHDDDQGNQRRQGHPACERDDACAAATARTASGLGTCTQNL